MQKYNKKTVVLDDEGLVAWKSLKENWILSRLVNQFLCSYEKNFSKYQHLIDLDLLPEDIFDRLPEGELEWYQFFKSFKQAAWRKSVF
jgi:hypothetical protein